MAAIDDKIQATKLILRTPKSFDQVRALGLQAAAAASGTLTKVHELEVDANNSITYNVKRAGFANVMSFGIVFNPAEDNGDNTVLLVPGSYITRQATLLVFIPIGPKDAAGYTPLKKFSEHIRAALS